MSAPCKVGDRVRLTASVADNYPPPGLPAGLEGTVAWVGQWTTDWTSQLSVDWDSGRRLNLLLGDGFEVERWRPVVGRGDYEVSNFGRVRSLLRGQPRILTPYKHPRDGHLIIHLGRDDKRTVHSLVLEAWVGPRPEGLEALHRDDDRDNNWIGNLYWGTSQQNRLDSVRNGTHHYARRASCDRGHEFTPENTRIRTDGGGRRCRTCDNESRERRRKP